MGKEKKGVKAFKKNQAKNPPKKSSQEVFLEQDPS